MDFTEAIGFAAGLLSTAANIPQTVKVIKTRSTKSLSAPTYAMLFIGLVLWTIYGFMQNDMPVILSNIVAGILCGTILTFKLIALRNPEQEKE